MKKIAMIIPTRERNHKMRKLHHFWFQTIDESISTDCIIVLDEDNESTYERLPNFIYEVVKPHPENKRGVTYPLNQAAIKLCDKYEYIGFMGDDHYPKTKNWNSIMYEKLNNNKPYSMIYANDLYQCINLPTQIIIDSLYIKFFGHMIDPSIPHLFCDNYWLYIGRYLNNIHYLDDVIIEHEHYTNFKSAKDDLYVKLSLTNEGEEKYYDLIKPDSDFNKKLYDLSKKISN